MQALLAHVPCLPQAAPPELMEGKEARAWKSGWGTGEGESQDKGLSPNQLQITHYISLQTEQEPRGGGWHLCHGSNPSWAAYNACPTPEHHTRVTPETVAPLVLKRWLVGVLLGLSRFNKAFIAPALPLLPPPSVTIWKQERYVSNLDLTFPCSCCAGSTMSSELKARGCSSPRLHTRLFRDSQRERK